MKRTLSLILVLVCLLSAALSSCSDNTADTETKSSENTSAESEGTETEVETETETELTLNLPEADFGDATCTTLIRTCKIPHFTADEITGEALNDAVYERNNKVSSEFGVNLAFVDLADDSGMFNNTIGQSIMARDGAYDIVTPDYWWKTEVNGWFMNLKEVDKLQLDMPWWCAGWNDAAEINGVLPGAVGYYTLDMIQNMNLIFFNKNLYDALTFDSVYSLDGMYNTVRDGKWTYDLFTQMCSAAAQDLDGDGKLSAGDRFGSLSDLQSGRALLWSSGMELCTHDENGNLVPTLTTEKNYDIFKSVLAFYEDNANSYGGDNGRIFMADQALFLMSSIDGAVQLRDMESDFGAIPYPKYDAADESYRSRNFGSSYFAIPITANNADMSATVLEAQNFYSYRDVRPTYYDTILKGKVSRDEETREMFDLVLDTCYIDTFFIYGSNLSFVADLPFNTVLEKQDKYMSSMKVQEKIVNKLLGKLAEAIQPENLG